MEKTISLVMTRLVFTVDSEETIDKVDALLAAHKLSAVPVVDQNGTLFGIISGLDLLRFYAARRNPKAVRAWELCTYKPITVGPEAPVSEVAAIMLGKGIHQIVVTDDNQLVGMVSALDFVRQCLPEKAMPETLERDEIVSPR